MRRYLIPTLLVVLVLTSGILAGCGQASSTSSLKTYTNYAYGYSIRHPSSWKVDESGETVLIYRSFNAYISIGTLGGQQLTAEDLEWLVENMVEELRIGTDDFLLISKRQLYDMDTPALEITYTGKTNEGLSFKAKCRCIIYRDRLYVVTIVSPGAEIPSEILAALNSFSFQ